MCKEQLPVFFLLGTSVLCCGVLADDIVLTVTTDKATYECGEPIELTVTVWNSSNRTYALAITPFDLPAHNLFNVKSPTGRPVHSQIRYETRRANVRPETIVLEPGQSHIVKFNLRDHYPPKYVPGGVQHFDEPGTYELSARYRIDYARHWPEKYEGIFVGPAESEPIRFTVKPLEGARLVQLLEQLKEDDLVGKAQALSLLRRGGVVADDIVFAVETDKATYEFAEPIRVTVTVENNSRQTYTLAQTPFHLPGRMLFAIESPEGKRLRSQREYGRYVIARRPATITLAPGDTHVAKFNLMDHYPEMHTRGRLQNFDEPGTYEVVARYYLDYAQHWPEHYEGIFIGPLESKPVRFVVKPLEGGRLEEILEQLREDDVRTKAKALSLLRRGRAVNRIPDLLQYLNKDQPRELRIAAARAIYDMPDPNAWQAYTEFLDDPTICGALAVALGKIGNKAAGDALYGVTDPERDPCYWLSFEALVQIGDPRAREVAALLAEFAESPPLRELAAKFFREGILREGSGKPANASQMQKP